MRRLIAFAMAVAGAAAGYACGSSPVNPEAAPAGTSSQQTRVPGEYLITLAARADVKAIADVYGRFGIKDIKNLGSNVCTPTGRDWIGVFVPGAANTSYVSWRYTTGTASGSLPLTVPVTVAPGTYELRLFANNGYTRLGTSSTFVVTSP